jgi:hypothetical protein
MLIPCAIVELRDVGDVLPTSSSSPRTDRLGIPTLGGQIFEKNYCTFNSF